MPGDAYYARELAAARASGVALGVGGNRFEPRSPITREDMMVMLHRALVLTQYGLDPAGEDALAAFSDARQISGYAREAVAVLTANRIVSGDNGALQPQRKTSRAETAVMLYRVLYSDAK